MFAYWIWKKRYHDELYENKELKELLNRLELQNQELKRQNGVLQEELEETERILLDVQYERTCLSNTFGALENEHANNLRIIDNQNIVIKDLTNRMLNVAVAAKALQRAILPEKVEKKD